MRQQTLRFGESWARIVPWRADAGAAQLVVGPVVGASAADVGHCLERARASGYTSMLTSAIAPRESGVFVDAGFVVHESLHLLSLALDTPPEPPRLALARATRRDRDGVLELDERSFDGFWRLGESGLRDALTATPLSRFRVARAPDHIRAYAITGLAGRQGYLQRIAVHPDDRRCGWGRALVADALAWLWENAVDDVVVNTQIDNHRALALYESFGFTRVPDGLCVLGRPL